MTQRIPITAPKSTPSLFVRALSFLGSLALAIVGFSNTSIAAPQPKLANVVHIAYVGGLTGNNSQAAQKSLKTLRLVVDTFNKTGGLLGKKFDVVPYDNKSSASNNITIFEQISKTDAIAVTGIHASNDGLLAAKFAEQYHLPLVVASATHPDITKAKKYVARVAFTDNDQGALLVRLARRDLKASRAVIIVDVAESFTTALAQIFEAGFKKAGGKVEEIYPIRTSDSNFEHIVKSLKERKAPDVIFMATSAMEAGFLLSQLASSGSRVPVLGCDGWQNSDLGKALKSLEQTHVNALFTAHWHRDVPRTESKNYIRDYEATYHEPLSSYDADAVLTYDAATLLLTAVRKAGSSNPDRIMAALRTTTIQGATGTITLGPNGQAQKDVDVLQIRNGKLMPYRMEQ